MALNQKVEENIHTHIKIEFLYRSCVASCSLQKVMSVDSNPRYQWSVDETSLWGVRATFLFSLTFLYVAFIHLTVEITFKE